MRERTPNWSPLGTASLIGVEARDSSCMPGPDKKKLFTDGDIRWAVEYCAAGTNGDVVKQGEDALTPIGFGGSDY